MSLPLPMRNRLADLILESLHEERARAGLRALVAVCDDPRALDGAAVLPEKFPGDFFERQPNGLHMRRGWEAHAEEFCGRARRGWAVVRARALDPQPAPLSAALAAAARLFDAGLFFEVHEQLEPYWLHAEGRERETLQGLIQVAVGFQHLANGNLPGARALLQDGAAKLRAGAIPSLDLPAFADAVERCRQGLAERSDSPSPFDWTQVPEFPVARG